MEKANSSSNDAASVPDPEVSALPKRRKFSAKYKLQILEQIDACKGQLGSIGAILRREGLYSSNLTEWRRERERGALEALGKKRGRKPTLNPLSAETERLRRENAELKRRLEQAEIIIDIQKKISLMLGIPLKDMPSNGIDS
jgi:transposase-like protein